MPIQVQKNQSTENQTSGGASLKSRQDINVPEESYLFSQLITVPLSEGSLIRSDFERTSTGSSPAQSNQVHY